MWFYESKKELVGGYKCLHKGSPKKRYGSFGGNKVVK